MRTRRLPNLAFPVLALIVVATVYAVTRPTPHLRDYPEATTWRGLVNEAHPEVTIGQRRIVVLRTPSVAQRLAAARYATEIEERQWTAQAYAAQQQVLVKLAAHGLAVRPDYTYTRVLDGFSAVLDPRAEALLKHDPDVVGVYPVRAAYPAAFSTSTVTRLPSPLPQALPGFSGLGVQIALLDTGVDRAQPYLRGHVDPGFDLIGKSGPADAEASPTNPNLYERHATELAGLIVGAGGPHGIHGAAPGATVFPVRVAGWQPTSSGRPAVYARSDQLI